MLTKTRAFISGKCKLNDRILVLTLKDFESFLLIFIGRNCDLNGLKIINVGIF